MVIYGLRILGLKDNLIIADQDIFNYKSEKVVINLNKELLNEIISTLKNHERFKDCDYLVVNEFNTAHKLIENRYAQDIPESLKDTYEESKELWNKVQNEVNILQLKNYYLQLIKEIEFVKKQSENLNLLDSQEYLNFLDYLNKLSLDQDRNDSK